MSLFNEFTWNKAVKRSVGVTHKPALESAPLRSTWEAARFCSLLLLVVAFAIAGATARADTTETFNFSGTLVTSYNGNNSVTGQFTLDPTTATITAFDFSTPVITIDSSRFYPHIAQSSPAFSPNTDFVSISFSNLLLGDYLHLLFQTDLASFSGDTFYTGGIEPTSDTGTVSLLFCESSGCSPGIFFSPFSSGSATPVTPTPEPGSVLLLGVGLLGLGIFGYGMRRSG